jgi:hypothetical protein
MKFEERGLLASGFETLGDSRIANFIFGRKCPQGCPGGPSDYRARGCWNSHYPDFVLIPSADAVPTASVDWLLASFARIDAATTPEEKERIEKEEHEEYDRMDDLMGFYRETNYVSRYGIRYIHRHPWTKDARYYRELEIENRRRKSI